jgi:hypothetical protein
VAEEYLEQVDRADPVDHRVVGLADEAEAIAAGDAIEDPQPRAASSS